MVRKISIGLVFSLLSGCAAMSGWFVKPTTQAVVADGCKAAAADDNMQNAILNQGMALVPQLAPVAVAINVAHLAMQTALAKCVSDASAPAGK